LHRYYVTRQSLGTAAISQAIRVQDSIWEWKEWACW